MTIPNPWNFIKAAWRFFQAWYNGEPVIVPEDVEADRWMKCRDCEFYDSLADQCEICGCPVQAKIMMSTEFCPRKKWKKWRPQVDKSRPKH